MSLFQSLQKTSAENHPLLQQIIESYKQIIDNGINYLIKQIETPSSFFNIMKNARANMINQYLGNDNFLVPYLEKINNALQQKVQQEVPQIPSSYNPQPAMQIAEENLSDRPIQLLPELQLKETPDVVNILSTINNLILENSKIKGSDLISNDAFKLANPTYKLLVTFEQEYDSAALTNLKQDIIKKIQNEYFNTIGSR